LIIEGQIQPRIVYTRREGKVTGRDRSEGGFEMRRTKIGLKGNVWDKNLSYQIKFAFDRYGGEGLLEQAWIAYKIPNCVTIKVGQFKGAFLHEETVSSSAQIAAERSSVNEFFTLDYIQGVQASCKKGCASVALALHSGREQDNTSFSTDASDVGATLRADFLLCGDWNQFKDFAVWSTDKSGALIGIAFDFASIERDHSAARNVDHYYQYTADLSVECYPFSGYAAFVGRTATTDNGSGLQGEIKQYGAVAQGSIMVCKDKVDLFGRWEWIEGDGFGELGDETNESIPSGVEDAAQIYVVGGNLYFKKHGNKITIDMMFAPEGVIKSESGAGTLSTDDMMWVFRVQWQLLF